MSDHPPIDWAAFARAELGLADEDADAIQRSASLLADLPDPPSIARRTRHILRALARWHMPPPTLLTALLALVVRTDASSRASTLAPVLDSALVGRAEMAAAWLTPASTTSLAAAAERTAEHGREARTPSQLRAERLRHLFWLAYSDWEAALIVVADHLAWGAELEASAGDTPREVLRPWCDETDGVFLPLLEMLGMWDLRREIGDRAFAIQQPAECALGRAYEDRYRAHHAENYQVVASELRAALERHGISSHIELHVSDLLSVQRAQRRAARRHERFTVESLLPTLRLNLVVATEEECYRALGVIHGLWRPVSRLGPVATGGRFYDYIATPRFNGYRRLITTVLADGPRKGEALRLLEFSIYTDTMRAVNGGGVAAALGGSASPGAIRNVWWGNEEHRALVRSRPLGATSSQIYVFSPLGEVYDLPEGSTPVDYAFGVHSQVGVAAKIFWVNGAPASYEYRLRNGDLVDVEEDTRYSALVPEWEKAARTTTAKVHIRRALTQRARSPHDGRALIDTVLGRELEMCKLRLTPAEIENALTRVARGFKCPNLYSLCVKVNEGTISPDQVAACVVQDQLMGEIVLRDGARWAGHVRIAQCWMAQKREAGKLDNATRVYPGVPIVGRAIHSKYHSTLVVHRVDCPEAPAPDAAIPLRWRSVAANREAVEIAISAFDRPHLLADILDTVYDFYLADAGGLYLHQVTATVHDDGTAAIALVVAVPTLEAIRPLEARFEALREAGTVHTFQTWYYSPTQRMHLAASTDRKARSPYGLQEVRTPSMFFGRHQEVEQLIDHLRGGQKLTVLYGHKRIGKTSLLYHLRDHALRGDPNVLPVYVDAQEIGPLTPSRILDALVDAGTEAVAVHFGGKATRNLRARARELRADQLDADPFHSFVRWANAAHQVLLGRRLIFMIDEFTLLEEARREGRLGAEFFARLRAVVGALEDIQLLICIHESIYTTLAAHPRRTGSWTLLQQGQAIRLTYLELEDAEHLIRQPMGRFYDYDDAVVRDILALTAGHPYYIQIICLLLASRMRDGTRTRVTAADLTDVTERLITQVSAYFNHFYEELPQRHRRALNAIVRASSSYSDWLDEAVIVPALRAQGDDASPEDVSRLLMELGSLGLLEWEETWRGMRHRIAVGLFHAWLRRHPLTTPARRGARAVGEGRRPR